MFDPPRGTYRGTRQVIFRDRVDSRPAPFYRSEKLANLFAARLVAGIFIAIGLIALIIPGVVLALRYSLLGAVVIVEGKGPSESRVRSTELTAGRRSQILGAMILFAILNYLLSSTIFLPLRYVQSLNVMPVAFVLACILYVAYSVKQIVLFLFDWESIQPIAIAEPADGADGGPAATEPDRSWHQ